MERPKRAWRWRVKRWRKERKEGWWEGRQGGSGVERDPGWRHRIGYFEVKGIPVSRMLKKNLVLPFKTSFERDFCLEWELN